MKFQTKNIENWQSWKMTFCLVFRFWLLGFSIFFLSMQRQRLSYELAFLSALWMVS